MTLIVLKGEKETKSDPDKAGESETGTYLLCVLLLALLRVGLVDPGMSGKLVTPRETLVAAWVRAGVRLLSSVGSDVTSL